MVALCCLIDSLDFPILTGIDAHAVPDVMLRSEQEEQHEVSGTMKKGCD